MKTLANEVCRRACAVERRDAHQPVHARFGAQPAVGPLPFDADGGALDPRLVARLPVELLQLEAFALGPAGVHAHQHLGPVLALGAAGAGVDADQRPLPVVGARQHARKLDLGDGLLDRREGGRRLDRRRLVLGLVGHVDEHARVLERLQLRVEGVHRGLESRLLAQHGLRLVGGVPEPFGAGLVVELRYPTLLAGDVKDAPGEPRVGSAASTRVLAGVRFPWRAR